MDRSEVERELAALIDSESRNGMPWWPGATMAPVAARRWSSFDRRHPRAKRPTDEDRILDLAKGLQAQFEPDIAYNPQSQWLHLATVLAKVLAGDS